MMMVALGTGPASTAADDHNLNHRLNGTYGVVLNHTCLTAPPGSFSPTLQLLHDASSTFSATCISRVNFDGEGHLRFTDNHCLGINTSLAPSGPNSNLPGTGASYFSVLDPVNAFFTCEGPYELGADGGLRFTFSCVVPAATITVSATRARGHVGQGQGSFVFAAVEPQVRTVSVGGVPVEQQFCVWNGTGERIGQ
jgi:hypothetical protein